MPDSEFTPYKFKKAKDLTKTFTYKRPDGTTEDVDDLDFYRSGAQALIRGASGFAPPGYIGFGVGAAAEGLAQTIGKEPYNLGLIGTAGAINAIPFGTTAKIGKSLIKGAGLGWLGTAAPQQVAEGPHVPTREELEQQALGAGLGAVGGGVGYGVGRYFGVGKVKPPVIEPPLNRGGLPGGSVTETLKSPNIPGSIRTDTDVDLVTQTPQTGGILRGSPLTGTSQYPIPATQVPQVALKRKLDSLPKPITNIPQVIEALPKGTGNPEYDNAVTRLQALRGIARIDGLNDAELKEYSELFKVVKASNLTPIELGEEITRLESKGYKGKRAPTQVTPGVNVITGEPEAPIVREPSSMAAPKGTLEFPDRTKKPDMDPITGLPITTNKSYYGDSEEAADLLRSEIKSIENRIANPELKPDGTRRYSDRVYAQDKKFLAEAKAELAGMEKRLKGPTPFVRTPTEPEFAKLSTKSKVGDIEEITGVGTELDRDAGIDAITNLYEGETPTIAVKELTQNSLDNIRPNPNGSVWISMDEPGYNLVVKDNGTGMTPDQLQTVYTTIGKSGKKAETDIGGYGIAKAGFQLTGKQFNIETIANDNGVMKKSSFSASPEDFKNKTVTVKVERVPNDTPTGTTVKIDLREINQDPAEEFIKNVGKYSGTAGKIFFRKKNAGDQFDLEQAPWTEAPNSIVKQGKILTTISHPEADYKLMIPSDSIRDTRNEIDLILLNRGMYQATQSLPVDRAPNLPDRIIVDIDSKIPALKKDYPWTPSRERLKGTAQYRIKEAIDKEIVGPSKVKRGSEIEQLYKNLPSVPVQTKRESVILDPGNRISPRELEAFKNNPLVQELSKVYDDIADEVINSMPPRFAQRWDKALAKVGFLFGETGHYGLHVPDPSAPYTDPKSAILVSFFEHASANGGDIQRAARETVTTFMHEVAHIGTHSPQRPTRLNLSDLNHPDIPEYFASYMLQAQQQGGISQGHEMDFIRRLGEIYENYGVKRWSNSASRLQQLATEPISGRYTSEFQKLLQFYTERKGRSDTSPDLLAGTGIAQRDVSGGPSNYGGNNPPTGTRTIRGATTRNVGDTPIGTTSSGGRGNQPPRVVIPGSGSSGASPNTPNVSIPNTNPDGSFNWKSVIPGFEKMTKGQQAWEIAKTGMSEGRQLKTIWDMSFPFRQGIGAVNKKEFWGSFAPMVQSFMKEENYNKMMLEIQKHPRFRQMMDAGLDVMNLDKHREEQLRGVISEHFVPGVKASNRAYTMFGNKLRTDLFNSMATEMEKLGIKVTGDNAKALARHVNDLTGRGSLGTLEGAAKPLNDLVFSPKLIASRVNMFRRAFGNQKVLGKDIDPRMRKSLQKEAIKSMLSIGGLALTSATASSLFNDKTETFDPLSADFGKLKIGDTRFDLTGGFQQYVRTAAQLASGMSNPEKANETEKGFGAWEERNRASTVGRAAWGKSAPVVNGIVNWMMKENILGEEFKWTEEAKAQVIPLIVDGLWDVWQEDRKMTIPALGSSMFGVGVQSYGPQNRRKRNPFTPRQITVTVPGYSKPKAYKIGQ